MVSSRVNGTFDICVKFTERYDKYVLHQRDVNYTQNLMLFFHFHVNQLPYTCSFLFKGVLHPRALFLKTLCIFSKNKATSNKVSYGSDQKCSKELKNHSFTSVETIVVKLQWKICKNQYFPCFEP